MDSPIPDEEKLRLMPFSELKKLAFEKGIMKKRKNMKAEKMIAKLLSFHNHDETDSFSISVSNEINSSKKNKEMKFDVDAGTPLATPRRGTYNVGSPTNLVEKVEADYGSPILQNSSSLDISNITILRGSERKLRPRKVSFVSPKKTTPPTSKYMSLKDRPKTPIPTRSMSRRTSMQNYPPNNEKEDTASKKKRLASPNFKLIHQKAFDKMESIVDYQERKKKESAKKLLPITRSKVTKVKTKIPVPFGGIPFIPSVTNCNNLKFDFTSTISNSREKKEVSRPLNCVSTRSESKQKAKSENIPVGNKKKKFDLQASLSRKLGYKPYTGPLKPLGESNCISSPKVVCHHTSEKEPVNNMVHLKRNQCRNILRGVRTNKRFDLQMKNRMAK